MAEQTITESRKVQQLKLFLEEEGHHKLFSDSHASEGESWGDCPVLAQLLTSFVDSCQSHQMPHAFGLLPCIALQSHPPLPSQTTAQAANDLETEKHLNLNLRQSKQELLAKIEELKQQIQQNDETIVDLEGQVRDLLVHLDASSSVAGNPDLQGASVTLPQQQPQPKNRGRKKK